MERKIEDNSFPWAEKNQQKEDICSANSGIYNKWLNLTGFPGWTQNNCQLYFKSMFAFKNCSVLRSIGFDKIDYNDFNVMNIFQKGIKLSLACNYISNVPLDHFMTSLSCTRPKLSFPWPSLVFVTHNCQQSKFS